MPKMFSPSTMFLKKYFAHENMKKPASKVAEPAQIQPESQFLFHKNLPPRDFSIMTLHSDMQCSPLTFFQDISINVQLCPRKSTSFFSPSSGMFSWTYCCRLQNKVRSLFDNFIYLRNFLYRVFKLDMRESKPLLGHQKCTLKS